MNCAIGIDVGGTKIAAGLVVAPEGRVLARCVTPTHPEQGGEAVLTHVIALTRSLIQEAKKHGLQPGAIGLGVAELVDCQGNVLSNATIGWKGLAVRERLRSVLPTRIEADVRAAALAEARVGAGRGRQSFVYVTVGTGISACLVVDGKPFTGAHGFTGTFASSRGLIPGDAGVLVSGPPVEKFAGGPGLASRYAMAKRGFNGTAEDVLDLAESGEPQARLVVESAGQALGAAIAQLVNVLDPEAVVIGGGLGSAGGLYAKSIEPILRRHIWCDLQRNVPLTTAQLGADAGLIGAAFAALPE